MLPLYELLPSGPLLLAFVLAGCVLAITPGPGVVYIVTRTLSQGRRAGLASVAGVAIGNFGNAAAAAWGMAAVLAASSAAFDLLRYAGAAYLVYLGIHALRSTGTAPSSPITPAGPGQVLRQGLLVALLNPKTTLFFAAFLPQFMPSPVAPVQQALALGALFVAIAAASDTAYVLLAGALAPALRASGRAAQRGRYLAAAVYLGLGVYAALAGSRPARS